MRVGRVCGRWLRNSCRPWILGPGWSGARAVSVLVALMFALGVPAQGLAGAGHRDDGAVSVNPDLRQYVEGASNARGGDTRSGIRADSSGSSGRLSPETSKASGGAASGQGFATGFIDHSLLTSSDRATRTTWLDRAGSAHADIIRIDVFWSSVAASKPANPTSPSDPAYDFSSVDAAVKDASARGFTVMLTVLDAPGWAAGKNPPSNVRVGSWKPDPKALGKFAQALA